MSSRKKISTNNDKKVLTINKAVNRFSILNDDSDEDNDNKIVIQPELSIQSVNVNSKNRQFIETKSEQTEYKNTNEEEHRVSDLNSIQEKGFKKQTDTIYVPPSSMKDGWTTVKEKEKREKLANYNENDELFGDQLKLNTTWNVWIHDNDNNDWSLDSYKNIFEIDSVGSMWRFLTVLNNLDKNVRQYYIMRKGITPIWEDNNNKNGAICSIMLDNLNRFSSTREFIGVDVFTAICILVMNESFVSNNMDINGLCYSIKSNKILIKLWVKDYSRNQDFLSYLPKPITKKIEDIIFGSNPRPSSRASVSVLLKEVKPDY